MTRFGSQRHRKNDNNDVKVMESRVTHKAVMANGPDIIIIK